MYTRAALDPLGILTELVPAEDEEAGPVCLQNVEYLSLVAELNYRFHPKWNVFAKGMYETGSAWGYQAGLEFFPMADDNLHFYLTGTGRSYSLTDRAKELGASIDNTQRLSVGFIYKLPLF